MCKKYFKNVIMLVSIISYLTAEINVYTHRHYDSDKILFKKFRINIRDMTCRKLDLRYFNLIHLNFSKKTNPEVNTIIHNKYIFNVRE